MATIAGKITAFQVSTTTFQPDTTTFQPVTTAFQPCATKFQTDTTIGSGHFGPTVDAVVLKMSKNTPAKQVACGEKGKPLSIKFAHFAEKSRGGGTIGCDFKLRVRSGVFRPLPIADGEGHRHLEAHTLPTLMRPEGRAPFDHLPITANRTPVRLGVISS